MITDEFVATEQYTVGRGEDHQVATFRRPDGAAYNHRTIFQPFYGPTGVLAAAFGLCHSRDPIETFEPHSVFSRELGERLASELGTEVNPCAYSDHDEVWIVFKSEERCIEFINARKQEG